MRIRSIGEKFLNALCLFCFFTYIIGGYSLDGTRGLSYVTDLFNVTSLSVLIGFAFGLDLNKIFVFRGFSNLQKYIQKKGNLNFSGRFVLFGCAILIMGFFAIPIIRHHSFASYFWDLTVMEQVIWRKAFGYGLSSTAITNQFNPPLDFLKGQHLNFWLIPISGIYRLFPYTETLLLLQSAALVLTLIPLWKISNEFLPKWMPPIILPILFWLWDTIHRNNIWDIHEACYLPMLSLWAYYFYLKRKWALVFIFTLAIGFFKEDAWVLAGAMAFYFFSNEKKWIPAIISFAIGFSIYASYGMFFNKVNLLPQRYAYLGNNFSDIVPTLVHNPFIFFQHLVTHGPLVFIGQVLTVSGGLWVFGGWAIVAIIPTFMECALSTNPAMLSFNNHYAIAFAGPLFFAAFKGLQRIDSFNWSVQKKKILLISAMAIALSQLVYSEPVQIKNYLHSEGWKNRECYLQLLAKIPTDAIVYSQDPLVSHLSKRPMLFWTDNVKTYLPNSYIAEPSGTPLPPNYSIVSEDCGQMIASNR